VPEVRYTSVTSRHLFLTLCSLVTIAHMVWKITYCS